MARTRAQKGPSVQAGTVEDIHPGDLVVYVFDGTYRTRVVSSAHPGYIITEEFPAGTGALDSPRKVPRADIYSVLPRPVQVPLEVAPSIKPAPEPSRCPAPAPSPAKPTVVALESPLVPEPRPDPETDIQDLWAMLGG